MLLRNVKVIILGPNGVESGITRLRERSIHRKKLWPDTFACVRSYHIYVSRLRNPLSGACTGRTRDSLGYRKRSDVWKDVNSHGNRGELEHGRDFVQNWSPGEVQMRERIQGGRRTFIHLRGERKMERRGAAMCLYVFILSPRNVCIIKSVAYALNYTK